MKLYLICVLILVFLLTVCFVSTTTVEKITDKTETNLLNAVDSYHAERRMEGYRQIVLSERIWADNNKILEIFLHHSAIEEVTTELAKLKAYAMSENTEELYGSFAELLALIKRIREMEYPFWINIL